MCFLVVYPLTRKNDYRVIFPYSIGAESCSKVMETFLIVNQILLILQNHRECTGNCLENERTDIREWKVVLIKIKRICLLYHDLPIYPLFTVKNHKHKILHTQKKSCDAIIYKNKYIYYTHVHSDIIKYRWKSSIRESTKLQIQKFIIQISYIK